MNFADCIELTGLRIFAYHGVLKEERATGQEFVIDVKITLDLRDAAAFDDVEKTIHYGDLAEEIAAAVRANPVDLIETVGERIADLVLAHERATMVSVTVHKPTAPISVPFADVSVTINRGRM